MRTGDDIENGLIMVNLEPKDNIVLPIKRATVEFHYITRLTTEQITLGFVNVDYVYSTTNNSDSHYILENVVKKIKLKDTGFPQLTAEDVIKHKVCLLYTSDAADE